MKNTLGLFLDTICFLQTALFLNVSPQKTCCFSELRNQKYDRKKSHSSLPNTPKNGNRVPARDCQTDAREPRKRRAAAISAGNLESISILFMTIALF